MSTLFRKAQLTVPCSPDHLGRVRETVRETLLTSHIPGETAHEIVSGVDETMSELMMRSRVIDSRPDVDLEIVLDGERVQVRITNDGACFDPQAPPQEGALPFLGIELIRKVFDDIRHSYADQGTNELVLTRNLGRPAAN